MGAQLNSISLVERRDKKVSELKRIIDEWDVQGGCFQEVGINWSATTYNRNMTSWFRLVRNETRTHTAHNIHKNMIKLAQQGGVAQFMCKDLVTYTKDTETDPLGGLAGGHLGYFTPAWRIKHGLLQPTIWEDVNQTFLAQSTNNIFD